LHSLRVISYNTAAFEDINYVKFAEATHILSAKEMWPRSLVFGNICFMGDDTRYLCRRSASCQDN